MAVYKPEDLGIKADTTGGTFQQGAWYNARQYWNGTLSEPGQIHPESNQVGAGQKVSSEVLAQTSVAAGKPASANETYINSLSNVPTFKDSAALQTYLNQSQNQSVSLPGTGSGRSVTDIVGEVKNLLPTTTPEAPKLADTFKDLSKEYGLDSLQATINDLTAQQADLEASLRVNKAAEEGKPVATNVIAGRISEQTRQAQEQYDFLTRQKARAVDQYNSALGAVKMIMDFTQTDYSNAKESYDSQFSQTLQLINYAQGVIESEKTDQQRAIDNARANLTIITNAIQSGNVDLNSVAPEQRAMINSLEVQAGLPIGFTSAIKSDPKANIVSITENQGQIQVLSRNADGSMGLQTYGTKNASSSKSDEEAQLVESLRTDIKSGLGVKDIFSLYSGLVDPNTIMQVYNANSPYGPAKESADDLAKYGVKPINTY